MKDINKKTEFDKHLEKIFQDAEMNPPDNVWSKIDSDLSKEEAGYFRRRAFMFKLLAAASIAFAMGVGVFSLNYYLNGTPGDISQIQKEEVGASDSSKKSETFSTTPDSVGDKVISSNSNDEANLAQVENSGIDSKEEPDQTNARNKDQSPHIIDAVKSGNMIADNRNLEIMTTGAANSSVALSSESANQEPEMFLSNLSEIEAKGIPNQTNEDLLYTIDHIFRIPFMPRGASKKNIREENDEGIFMASLDFSAGQFNPNFQQGASSAVAPSGPVAYDYRSEVTSFDATNKNFLLVRSAGQETKPELTYSYGANIGFKVSNRFLLQTGFAYRKANTTTTTTGYIENVDDNSRIPIVASYQYQLEGLSSVKRIDEVGLNNRYEFASIPVRAGYILLNRKINITLLAGISSEIFINNSIADESNFLQTISSSDASESPYRDVYFNGTLGTMLGYSFAKNYSLTLEPSYRMAINSFTKDSFYLSSYPSSFMLSFGVAYNFR